MDLSKEQICSWLSAPNFAPIAVLEETESTNDLAKKMAREGAPHGTAVIADRQTAGRGRLGRSFFSPSDAGIYLSVVLRSNLSVQESLLVTPAAAVATARAIRRVTGIEVKIKWVNDLYVKGKKICGILSEASFSGQQTLDYMVVGIGINVRDTAFPPELCGIVSSLSTAAGGAEIDRNKLIAAIIEELLGLCEALPAREFLAEYRERSCVLGKTVTLLHGGETREAVALEIDDDARLLVQETDGCSYAIGAGEISLKGDWN